VSGLLLHLLTPFPPLVLLMGVGLWWVWRKHPKPRRRLWLLIVPYLLLVLMSSPVVEYLALNSLERGHPPLQTPPDDLDAIVVLGSYVYPANKVRPEPELDDSGLARAHAAAKLYHRTGKRLWVVVSGGKPDADEPGPAPADVMAEVLRLEGVDRDRILIDNQSVDTANNAEKSAALLRAHGCRRIALVTDGWHVRRAAACFRKQGLDVTEAGCGYRAIAFDLEASDLVPSTRALWTCQRCAREWRSWWWYRLRGKV